jgi:hypothetical protein
LAYVRSMDTATLNGEAAIRPTDFNRRCRLLALVAVVSLAATSCSSEASSAAVVQISSSPAGHTYEGGGTQASTVPVELTDVLADADALAEVTVESFAPSQLNTPSGKFDDATSKEWGILPTTDMVVAVTGVLWEREGGFVSKRLTPDKKLVVRLQGGSVDVTMSVKRATELGFEPGKGGEGPAPKSNEKITLTFAQPVGVNLKTGQQIVIGLSMVSKIVATKSPQPERGKPVLATTNFNSLGVFAIHGNDLETAPDVVQRTISLQDLVALAKATPSKKTE